MKQCHQCGSVYYYAGGRRIDCPHKQKIPIVSRVNYPGTQSEQTQFRLLPDGDWYYQPLSCKAIAEVLPVSIKRNAMVATAKPLPTERCKRRLDMHAAGKTDDEIAEIEGVSRKAIVNWRFVNGLTAQKQTFAVNLAPKVQAVLDLLKENPKITIHQVAGKLGIAANTARGYIKQALDWESGDGVAV